MSTATRRDRRYVLFRLRNGTAAGPMRADLEAIRDDVAAYTVTHSIAAFGNTWDLGISKVTDMQRHPQSLALYYLNDDAPTDIAWTMPHNSTEPLCDLVIAHQLGVKEVRPHRAADELAKHDRQSWLASCKAYAQTKSADLDMKLAEFPDPSGIADDAQRFEVEQQITAVLSKKNRFTQVISAINGEIE